MKDETKSEVGKFSLEEAVRKHVLYVIELCDGNINKAARMLDIERQTIYRKLAKWGLSVTRQAACLPKE